MRISKNRVLDFLTRCQIEKGGYYTGSDVTILSIPVSQQALRKRIDDWSTSDQTFGSSLFHVGRCRVAVVKWLQNNPKSEEKLG